jgi:prepilin-type N-terminal cleavage/methylation domain-containing protein
MTTRLTRMLTEQRGFTLAEVLVAVFVILVGLIAVATGFQYATSGVATGRGETVATFLAEQRVEQLKTIAMTNYTGPWTGTSLAAGTTTEYCQSSNIGATSSNCQATAFTGTATYTRTTTITDNPGGTGCTGTAPMLCKRIRVSVSFRPVTSSGDLSQTRTVDVYAVVAPRS